ncbi:MAG: transcriptional regulator [Rhizobiales bacterium]|nr:transcriptional regulator [Hyphomicrobiales bacterium]MBA70266.1 transcriptional regulator [Hyphomicrobiales bacterium]|tara:strand:- start:1499 stop:1897 length:399 start_codon:yes stop_codon:yes gene_type:complete
MKPTHSPFDSPCKTVTDIISLIGDKWSVLVIKSLGDGRLRFTEIKRSIDGVSQKMLTTTLRGLERDGYISRTVYPTVPMRVEYELTDLGVDLLEPISALGQWAVDNHHRVVSARRRYDGDADMENRALAVHA